MPRFIPFALLLAAAAITGAATIVHAGQPASVAIAAVYGTWWMQTLWAAVAVTLLIGITQARLYRRPPVMLLHLALIGIATGGFTTAITHRTGAIHLRTHQAADAFIDTHRSVHHLPFSLRLDTFYVDTYPATTVPRDYVSQLTLADTSSHDAATHRLSMNQIVEHRGYRLYQTSYDPDRQGSILTVTYDPIGRHIVYTSFLLFALSITYIIISRHLRRPKQQSGDLEAAAPEASEGSDLQHNPVSSSTTLPWVIAILTAALVIAITTYAAQRPSRIKGEAIPCVTRIEADSAARQLIVWNGRVCPFSTCATDVALKLTGQRRPYGYTPEQLLLSWQRYPDVWSRAPLLLVKDKALRETLTNSKGRHVALSQLYDGESYRLQPLYDRIGDSQSKAARSIRELDERVGIVAMLLRHELWTDYADASASSTTATSEPPTALHVSAELLYNRLPIVSILFMANLTLGFLAFGLIIAAVKRRTKAILRAETLLQSLHLAALLLLALEYSLRWYVSGEPPMAGGFESMLTVALAILLTSTYVSHRQPQHRLMAIAFGLTMSGFALLVAHLSQANPQVTPLMPVLRSPWLTSHVSTIMVSYALLAFTFILAIVDLLGSRRATPSPDHSDLSRSLLLVAVALLGIGIALGAVWAGRSWGSYWSWDPKEVWALITLIVYALPLHSHSLTFFRHPRHYNTYIALAFAAVLMTYFGVNNLLGGMHSYAS